MKHFLNYIFVLSIILYSCGGSDNTESISSIQTEEVKVKIPEFNADSAFHYVKMQVDFGPRVPNTKSHTECSEFLYSKLKSFSDTVIIQKFKTRAFDGTVLNGKNIIASFNPETNNRIFLSAHWDSRPFADHDPDEKNHRTPIDGANDGASGVGVLLEIARQLHLSRPTIGVDIILFDTEDYGEPQDSQTQGNEDTWGLGSQYWSKNPHKTNYFAKYGILLDMVGASDARFLMEGWSLYYAPEIVKKVWNIAHKIGYIDYFLFEEGGYITDDHYYVNKIKKIPTIDIIHLDTTSPNGTFFPYWHTVKDNIKIIDKWTLKVVGQTVLTVVLEEK
ncbi:MAG: M28 family peptidase [Bacteroidales bacterium]|nr:M28 family peptidase [Bacteroidales bacterium]